MAQRKENMDVIVAVQDGWSLEFKGGEPVLGRWRSVIQRLRDLSQGDLVGSGTTSSPFRKISLIAEEKYIWGGRDGKWEEQLGEEFFSSWA